MGLLFKEAEFSLTGYTDADFGGDLDDRRGIIDLLQTENSSIDMILIKIVIPSNVLAEERTPEGKRLQRILADEEELIVTSSSSSK